MNFTELVAEVYTITNRPDLVAETALAVKSATLTLHRKDSFYKDLFETALQYTTVDYLQTIDYRTLFANYRSLKYLRKFDPTSTPSVSVLKDEFEIVTPDQVFDSYNLERSDVCYVAGSVIQVKSSTKIGYSLIGVYLNPIVSTPATYSSWIALEAPYAIVFAAAALIFGNTLGDRTRQDINAASSAIEFASVWNSNILANGS